MSRYLVLGAGPIGRAITAHLLADGDSVTVVTRSGTEVPGATAVAMAGDDPRLAEVMAGADAVVVATNPPYHRWESEWPPLMRNVIDAAAASGSAVLLVGNLYGYAPGVVMTADVPLAPSSRKGAVRARLWDELLAAHDAGRLRATELRASDYYGPEALATDGAHAGARLVTPVLAGKTAYVIGAPDAPHSWTAVGDIAAAAAAALRSDVAWGRPWIVPTDAPRTIRQLADDVAQAAGIDRASVRRIPRALIHVAGLVDPMMREMREVLYQHDAPFGCDGSETTRLLGVEPTPLPQVVAATVAAARQPQPA